MSATKAFLPCLIRSVNRLVSPRRSRLSRSCRNGLGADSPVITFTCLPSSKRNYDAESQFKPEREDYSITERTLRPTPCRYHRSDSVKLLFLFTLSRNQCSRVTEKGGKARWTMPIPLPQSPSRQKWWRRGRQSWALAIGGTFSVSWTQRQYSAKFAGCMSRIAAGLGSSSEFCCPITTRIKSIKLCKIYQSNMNCNTALTKKSICHLCGSSTDTGDKTCSSCSAVLKLSLADKQVYCQVCSYESNIMSYQWLYRCQMCTSFSCFRCNSVVDQQHQKIDCRLLLAGAKMQQCKQCKNVGLKLPFKGSERICMFCQTKPSLQQ